MSENLLDLANQAIEQANTSKIRAVSSQAEQYITNAEMQFFSKNYTQANFFLENYNSIPKEYKKHLSNNLDKRYNRLKERLRHSPNT